MKITIHRGSHQIGGNCIEIETDKARIILDVGMPLFKQDGEPHNTQALRRQSPTELLQNGILPKVSGLFGGDSSPDAVLLSHAHEDHTGLIQHSNPNIPIYASVGTSKMMLAGAKFAGQPILPRERHRELRSGQSLEIGNFTITPFSVDHSIYGSQAFLIEAEGKSVLYSGDLRLHGRKPGMHRSLIDAVKDQFIDVLLMEGTHIAHSDQGKSTEYELEEEILGHIQSAPGLVLASFSPQHVDRLVGFYRATLKSGRTFIADAYAAFIMHLIASEIPIPRPESGERIKVFFPRFFEETYQKKRLESFFTLMSPARMGMEEIRSNPSQYVMLFRPSMLESDFGGTLPKNALCLYSRWAGYLEQLEWRKVKSVLAQAHGNLIEVHTSGHIYSDDISKFIQHVQPKLVIPIHTFQPERFQEIFPNVKVLNDGEVFELE